MLVGFLRPSCGEPAESAQMLAKRNGRRRPEGVTGASIRGAAHGTRIGVTARGAARRTRQEHAAHGRTLTDVRLTVYTTLRGTSGNGALTATTQVFTTDTQRGICRRQNGGRSVSSEEDAGLITPPVSVRPHVAGTDPREQTACTASDARRSPVDRLPRAGRIVPILAPAQNSRHENGLIDRRPAHCGRIHSSQSSSSLTTSASWLRLTLMGTSKALAVRNRGLPAAYTRPVSTLPVTSRNSCLDPQHGVSAMTALAARQQSGSRSSKARTSIERPHWGHSTAGTVSPVMFSPIFRQRMPAPIDSTLVLDRGRPRRPYAVVPHTQRGPEITIEDHTEHAVDARNTKPARVVTFSSPAMATLPPRSSAAIASVARVLTIPPTVSVTASGLVPCLWKM